MCTVPPGLTGTAQLWSGEGGGRGCAYRILKLRRTGTHWVYLRLLPSFAGLFGLLHDVRNYPSPPRCTAQAALQVRTPVSLFFIYGFEPDIYSRYSTVLYQLNQSRCISLVFFSTRRQYHFSRDWSPPPHPQAILLMSMEGTAILIIQ
jgi:hypothetical protein